MARRRVLLVHPSSFGSQGWGGDVQPLKAHMLSLFSAVGEVAPCEALDLEVELGRPEDAPSEAEFALRAARLLGEREFDVVAVSCWTSLSYRASLCVLDAAASARPEALRVVGGYHPTARPRDFDGRADVVVRGEGERALADIARGRARRGSRTRVVDGSPMPMGAAPRLDWERYPYLERGSPVSVYLSRGCPHSCAFCMEGVKGGHRALPVAEALRAVREAVEAASPSEVRISDACFGAGRAWRRSLLAGLAELGAGVPYWAEARADALEEEDARLLARLRFRIDLGLDSASEAVLAAMTKAPDPRAYLARYAAAEAALDAREVPHATYLLFDHPGETRRTVGETLSFMGRLVGGKRSTFGWLAAQPYAFFPGSDVDLDLASFERRFGTRVLHPRWWEMEGSLLRHATRVVPSSALTLAGLDFWKAGFRRLQRLAEERLDPRARGAVGVRA